MLPRFLLIGVLLLALVVVPGAEAQQVTAVTVTFKTEEVSAGPNQTQQATASVQNAGSVAGNVALTVTQPAGWTATVSPASLTNLAPGASQDVTVSLTAGPDGANPPATGPVQLTARIAGPSGLSSVTGSDQVRANYVAPPPPPPPPAVVPPEPNYVLPITLGIIALALLIGLAIYFFQARTVGLQLDGQDFSVLNGGEAHTTIDVANRSGRPSNVELRVRGLPSGWFAALSYPSINLQGREHTNVPLLMVKAPLGAQEPARFLVEARPNKYSPWLVKQDVTVNVVDAPSLR